LSRRYRVAEPWANHKPGDEVSAADYPGINFPALVSGAIVEPVSPRVACPACTDAKAKKVPNFEKADTFADHYATEHPALAAPDFEGVA
jgi:hypothetical protein